MYQSKYYTCEEIDERLLKGYYDDAVSKGYSDTFEQFKTELASIKDIAKNKESIQSNANAINTNAQAIMDEIARAKTAETELNDAINAEKERAQAAEQANSQGIIYDVSANNDGAVFESLQSLLSSSDIDSLIPISVRCGGMSIRFINSLDNKYVQYRYTGIETISNPTTFLDNANWKCTDYTIIFENTEEKEFILPNILNKCGTIRSLAIYSFQGAQEGCVNEYMLEFTVSGDDFTLALPEGVRWTEEPTWENGYTYQVSIVDNLAVFAGWEAQTNE